MSATVTARHPPALRLRVPSLLHTFSRWLGPKPQAIATYHVEVYDLTHQGFEACGEHVPLASAQAKARTLSRKTERYLLTRVIQTLGGVETVLETYENGEPRALPPHTSDKL